MEREEGSRWGWGREGREEGEGGEEGVVPWSATRPEDLRGPFPPFPFPLRPLLPLLPLLPLMADALRSRALPSLSPVAFGARFCDIKGCFITHSW